MMKNIYVKDVLKLVGEETSIIIYYEDKIRDFDTELFITGVKGDITKYYDTLVKAFRVHNIGVLRYAIIYI